MKGDFDIKINDNKKFVDENEYRKGPICLVETEEEFETYPFDEDEMPGEQKKKVGGSVASGKSNKSHFSMLGFNRIPSD